MEFVPTNNLTMDQFAITKMAAKCDFQSFTLFPPSTPSRLLMMLGLAVYIHSHVKCPTLDDWRASTWLPRVSSIVSFASNFSDLYTNPAFWRNIAVYVTEIIFRVCQSEKREELEDRIRQEKDLRLDAADELLRIACRYMCFDLIVMRKVGETFTVEAIRCDDAIGLPVVIAEEDDSLLFLYHKNLFNSTPSSYLPYYFFPPKPQISFPGFQPLETSFFRVLQTSHELLVYAMRTIASLSHDGIPSAMMEQLETLNKKCSEYRVITAMYGLEQLESLDWVKEMDTYSDENHPVGRCEEFALLEPAINLPICEHRFHIACLSKHFQQQLDSGQPASSLLCPICSVLTTSETISKLSLKFPIDSAVEASNPVMMDFYECKVCKTSKSTRVMVSHQGDEMHFVCIYCFTDVRQCPVCGGAILPQHQTWIEQALQLLGSRL